MRLFIVFLSILGTLSILSCSKDAANTQIETVDPGPLVTYSSSIGGSELYDMVVDQMSEISGLDIVATIDHSNNAEEVEMSLPFTRVILYTHKDMTDSLLNQSPTIALDLPLKVYIKEDLEGNVSISYQHSNYLAARHGIENISFLLSLHQEVEQIFTEVIDEDISNSRPPSIVDYNEGVITNTYDIDYKEAKNVLKTLTASHVSDSATLTPPSLESKKTISQTDLILIHDYNITTPLIQENLNIGIEFPAKILISENNGGVNVMYTDPYYIAQRYSIHKELQQIKNLDSIYNGISQAMLAQD